MPKPRPNPNPNQVSGEAARPCMLRALRGLWGAKLWGAKRGARAEGWADARPESWHDDFWIWEGRVVVDLMRAIRAAHAPRSAADAVLTAEAGMLSNPNPTPTSTPTPTPTPNPNPNPNPNQGGHAQ